MPQLQRRLRSSPSIFAIEQDDDVCSCAIVAGISRTAIFLPRLSAVLGRAWLGIITETKALAA